LPLGGGARRAENSGSASTAAVTCTTKNVPQGIGFEIDHYVPVARDDTLANAYVNLMYSWATCNRKKGDAPEPEVELLGFRFIRADQEDPRDHVGLDGTTVSPRTEVGTYTIEMLDLNRQALMRVRTLRERFAESLDEMLMGVKALEGISIDRFHPRLRATVLGLKKRVASRKDRRGRALDYLLRELNRSELLDEDPEARQRARDRREYLKTVKSVVP
jgi:hypothetical protein